MEKKRLNPETGDASGRLENEALAAGHSQRLESLGLLAGGVAHDFNNLLTGILGNASLALELLPDVEAVRPLLEDVIAAAYRAAGLTRQVLAYSGKGKLLIEPFGLSTAVAETCRTLGAGLPKSVDVRLDLAEELPLMLGEVSQIHQIVMNLVLNAAESLGERAGVVMVRTRQERIEKSVPGAGPVPTELPPGEYLVLEVEDEGSGMDAETQTHIFDPSFSTKNAGRGLGLVAVANSISRYSGAIQVHSEPGRGSIFRVLFPRSAASAARSGTEAPEPAVVQLSGTVLVVDDEESVRRVAKLALTRLGCSVLVAADGVEAIEVFRQSGPEISLILLDMTMPRLSGAETLHRLREIRADVPVVISSGYGEIEAARRLPLDSVAGFLQKPYTATILAAKVTSVLAGREPGAGRIRAARNSID
ncbi:MAG TPA: response regulator [Bryobacteraceae bacterium]|nr:response regulator [Bryobacteraceae bacterium]